MTKRDLPATTEARWVRWSKTVLGTPSKWHLAAEDDGDFRLACGPWAPSKSSANLEMLNEQTDGSYCDKCVRARRRR